MRKRVDPFSVRSESIKALVVFEASTLGSGVEPSTLRLAKLRASLSIGSEFCVERYRREAIASGESVRRLDAVQGWRSSVEFSNREKAALAWAEAVARARESQIPDALYEAASRAFDPQELVALTAAIAAATAWNQIGLAFRLALPDSGACSQTSAVKEP